MTRDAPHPGREWPTRSQGKRRFFEKKRAKNFAMPGHGRWCVQRPRPSVTKIFAPLFFKKRLLSPNPSPSAEA
jgi:hypothetical protein